MDENNSISKCLEETVMEMNSNLMPYLKEFKEKSVRHCGATGIITYIKNENIYAINVGDCRTVLYKDKDEIIRLSFDHKPNEPEESKWIRENQGHIINGRVNGIFSSSRAFGDFYLYPRIRCEPYFSTNTFKEGSFILMCTDGVWDEISETLAGRVVRSCFQQGFDAHKTATVLRDYSYLQGSDDNVSVMVIKL